MKNEKIIEDLKIIVFRLMNEEYGVDVSQVLSIERVQHITRVPKSPPFVKGVINLRGKVIPVIDLRSRFDMPEITYSDTSRIIIVSISGIEVGLIVDAANDVIDIPRNLIEPAPQIVTGIDVEYLEGIAKINSRLLILLNLTKVLKLEELKQLEKLED